MCYNMKIILPYPQMKLHSNTAQNCTTKCTMCCTVKLLKN